MIKFTPEEINLCKQVAKKHRKEIVQGDWIVNSKNKRFLVSGVELWKSQRPGLEHTMAYDLDPVDRLEDAIVTLDEQIKEYIPLWTVSDCLEFLKKKGFHRISLICWSDSNVDLWITEKKGENAIYDIIGQKTPLEACLKAVLAELEETKDIHQEHKDAPLEGFAKEGEK